MAIDSTTSQPPPPPTEGRRVLFYLRDLHRWLKKTQAVPGVGLRSRQTESGRIFSAEPGRGGGGGPHPWRVTRADDGEQKRIRVHPGTINGVLPTNILSLINYTAGENDLRFVVLNVVADGAGITTCSLSVDNSQPDSPDVEEGLPPQTFKDLIAVIFQDQIRQIRFRNISALSEVALIIDAEEAEPFRSNVIRFYTWSLRD